MTREDEVDIFKHYVTVAKSLLGSHQSSAAQVKTNPTVTLGGALCMAQMNISIFSMPELVQALSRQLVSDQFCLNKTLVVCFKVNSLKGDYYYSASSLVILNMTKSEFLQFSLQYQPHLSGLTVYANNNDPVPMADGSVITKQEIKTLDCTVALKYKKEPAVFSW
jgi:hypothetical protein